MIKKYVRTVMFLLILFALILIFRPACPLYTFAGIQCPGCGTTRLFINLLKLNFVKAYESNPFVFVFGLPTILMFVDGEVNPPKRTRIRKIYFVAIIIVAVIFMIFRNI